MSAQQPEVGHYDPTTGRMTILIEFGTIGRRGRKRCLDLMVANGLTHNGGLFAPHQVRVTGTEAQFLAYGAQEFEVTHMTSDMPMIMLRFHQAQAWRREHGR